MPFFLLVVFAVFCLVLIAQVIAKPERVYECPWFMAFAFTGFIMPQAYGLVVGKFAPDDWIAATMLMCILCLGACCLAYHKTTPGVMAIRRLSIEIDPVRFAISGFVFVLIGIWFDRLINALQLGRIQWVTAEGRVDRLVNKLAGASAGASKPNKRKQQQKFHDRSRYSLLNLSRVAFDYENELVERRYPRSPPHSRFFAQPGLMSPVASTVSLSPARKI